jgi:hypothetical protein
MRASVALRNVVGEAQHVLMIAVVPPQGAINRDAVLLAVNHDRTRQHSLLGAVEIAHEGGDAALIVQFDIARFDAALVGKQNAYTGIEEGQLTQTMFKRGEIEFGLGEGAGRGQEGHFGAAAARCFSDDAERRIGIAMRETHEMLLAIAEDG